MRLRFLETIPSMNPHVPFMAGQIIDGIDPSQWPELAAWLADERVAILPDETAMLGAAPERAVKPRAVHRGRR